MAGIGTVYVRVEDASPRGSDYGHPGFEQFIRTLWANWFPVSDKKFLAYLSAIQQVPASPANYSQGRLGYGINGIIIHTVVGSLASADGAFQNPARQASAHYGIQYNGDGDGPIHQYVAESNIAWHCGRFYSDGSNPLANVNCVTPDTKILLANLEWVTASELIVGSEILGFDEFPIPRSDKEDETVLWAGHRYFKSAIITTAVKKEAPVYEVTLANGDILKSTGEHRWLFYKGRGHGSDWIRTDRMSAFLGSPNRTKPLLLSRYFTPIQEDHSYEGGFLAAAFDSEGGFRFTKGEGLQLCFTQNDNALWERVKAYLTLFGFTYGFMKRSEGPMTLWLRGGKAEVYRFLFMFKPPRLINRWMNSICEFQSLWPQDLVSVESVKEIGNQEIVALSSSSLTYIAEGFGSHNTIGIEHADNGAYNSPRPDALYDQTVGLVKAICARYGIPIDRTHIRKHNEVSVLSTGCPDSLDINRIVAMANGTYGPIINSLTSEEDMLYVGPIHSQSATFKTFAAGTIYRERTSTSPAVSNLAVGASVSVDAYCYSNSPVNCTDLDGKGTQGPDWLWWRSGSNWVPDAILSTTPVLPTAPGAGIPVTEPLDTLFATQVQVKAIPAGTTDLGPITARIVAAEAKEAVLETKTTTISQQITNIQSGPVKPHTHPITTTGTNTV